MIGGTFTGSFYEKGHIIKITNPEFIERLQQLQPFRTGFYNNLSDLTLFSFLKFQLLSITLNRTRKSIPRRVLSA